MLRIRSYVPLGDRLDHKTVDKNIDIRWKFTSKLEDIDFPDDIALISSNRHQNFPVFV